MTTAAAPRYRDFQRSLTPKNGERLIVLLAGGPADRARELQELLAKKKGVLVKYHWDYRKEREWVHSLPVDVDLVIGLKTMMGHGKSDLLRRLSKKTGVPLCMTSHKWSTLASALYMRFRLLDTAEPQPVPVSLVPQEPEPEVVAPAPPPEPELRMVELPPPPTPPPPTHDEELHAIRMACAGKDTMTLVRELQLRLKSMGLHAILIDVEQVTFSTDKAEVKV